ncbi:MAG: ABC transporter ATP-binding protein, partial [Eubacteriales bacterium]
MHNEEHRQETSSTSSKGPMGGGPRMGPPGGGPGGPGMAVGEKAKDFSGSLKKLFAYCGKYRIFMAIAMGLAIIASTCSLIGPGKLSDITDLITEGMMTEIDLAAVGSIGILLCVLYGLSLILGYTQSSILAIVSQKICKNLRKEMVEKLNRLPLSYFDSRSYGDTLSRVTNDVDTIGTSLNQSLSSLISGIFTFVGALILMFYSNWIMAISGLLSTMIGFSLMAVIIKNSQLFFRKQQEGLGDLNGHIEETYAGHTIIKAYNGEEFARKHFTEKNETLYKSAWKAQFLSGLMMPIMNFVGNFA